MIFNDIWIRWIIDDKDLRILKELGGLASQGELDGEKAKKEERRSRRRQRK
jgi:hypothetical protein